MSASHDLDEFRPNSLDATLARILANQDEAARKADKILVQVEKTNGRVTTLETWRAVITEKTAILSGVVAASISVVGWMLHLILQ